MRFNIAVCHIGGHGRILIHYAYAYIQGSGNPCFRINGNRNPCIHVQVIDRILMRGFYLRVVCIINSSVGHHSNGRTQQLVGIHIVTGLERNILAARYRAGHVKRGHGLLCVRSHSEVIGIDGIFCFAGIRSFFLRSVPFSSRRGYPRRRHPVNLVGRTGKAGRNTCFRPDSYGSRAAEFRHVGIIRRIHVHVAAGLRRIQFGIQYFRRSLATHIVQVHHTGQRTCNPAISHAHGHTAVGHDGRNGMRRRSVYYNAGLRFFLTAFFQSAYISFFIVSFAFGNGPGRPGMPGHRAVNHVFIIIRVIFQRAGHRDLIAFTAFGHHRAVFNQRIRFTADLIVSPCHADCSGDPIRFKTYVQHAGIVVDGLVALRHDACVTRAVDSCVDNLRNSIVFNVIVAA